MTYMIHVPGRGYRRIREDTRVKARTTYLELTRRTRMPRGSVLYQPFNEAAHEFFLANDYEYERLQAGTGADFSLACDIYSTDDDELGIDQKGNAYKGDT